MKREIQITKDVRRELINQFGTTRKTLHQALNYLGRSELLEHIRNEALRRGGVVVITVPEEEVLLDMGDKLVQSLGNDVRLVCDKGTGNAYIYRGGLPLQHLRPHGAHQHLVQQLPARRRTNRRPIQPQPAIRPGQTLARSAR